jgi:excisionase family DNA binding protein
MQHQQSLTPLYVRLPSDQAQRLDDAVAATGQSKRQLVEDAVRAHLGDDKLVVGRVALRDETEVLTLGEAAALLRIGEDELTAAVEAGEVPARSIGGDWRLSRSALLAWLGGDGVVSPMA